MVNLTAVNASGWVFDHWSGNLSGSVNPESIVMDCNKSVTAHFVEEPEESEEIMFNLTVDVVPFGSGSVVLDPSGGVYEDGRLVNLTAVNASGWVFDHWGGDDIDGSINLTENITMDNNKSVIAYFIEIDESQLDTDDDIVEDDDPDDDVDGWPDTDSGTDDVGPESNLEDDTNKNSYNYNYKNKEEDNTLYYIAVVIAFLVFIIVSLFILREENEDIEAEDVKVDVFNSKI